MIGASRIRSSAMKPSPKGFIWTAARGAAIPGYPGEDAISTWM